MTEPTDRKWPLGSVTEPRYMAAQEAKNREMRDWLDSVHSAAPLAVEGSQLGLREGGDAAPLAEGSAQEPIAWRATTICYRRFITQSQYENFSPAARRWYEPFRCAHCRTAA